MPSGGPPSTILRVSAPTVVILAAGEGTRMRSATPKVLHPICGRPLIGWPVLAAQRRRRRADRRRRQPAPRAGGGAARRRRGRRAGVAARHRRRREGGGRPHRSGRAGGRALRRRPADHRRGDRRARRAPTRRRARRPRPRPWCSTTRRATAASCAAPDGTVERVVETKTAGDATPEELEIREVNSGIYAFDGGALLEALERIEPANAQGEYYLPDVLGRSCASRGCSVAAHVIERPDARARDQRPGRPGAGPRAGAGAHPRGPRPRRGDDRRSRLDPDRGRGDHRPRHDRRALDLPARRDARSASAAWSGR